jgi:hypothetical protein
VRRLGQRTRGTNTARAVDVATVEQEHVVAHGNLAAGCCHISAATFGK